ncbi:MAG: OprO/OprP family phosphate-selective porin, partial [Aquificaceae bacterium]|nr:OprO/OprP family phosphate-selective porin [Aquificaceae bacterium]
MRKSLLAVAALMGVAALPQRAEAVAFRVAEDISGNMGFRGQIWGQVLGERTSGNKGAVDFRLNNVRLYANGNVGKYMFFGANLDFEPGTARASDAFIGIRFQDEFRVQAGLFRTPFSRAALTDSYTF